MRNISEMFEISEYLYINALKQKQFLKSKLITYLN